jgi:hypothetical protein
MMKFTTPIIAVSLFLLFPVLGLAQEFSYPKLVKSGKSLDDFEVKGWFLKDTAEGDLNGDRLADLAFVMEYRDTIVEKRSDGFDNKGSPRILVVLFKNTSGKYDLFLQNNTFIIRYGEGGMDPEAYGDLLIEKGILIIRADFLRSVATYKFRYQNKDLFLIGGSTAGVSGGIFESFDVNFSTGKAKMDEGPIDSEKINERWVTIPRRPLKKLREMRMMFEFEVIPNRYL